MLVCMFFYARMKYNKREWELEAVYLSLSQTTVLLVASYVSRESCSLLLTFGVCVI